MLCTIVVPNDLVSTTSNAAVDASENESVRSTLSTVSKRSKKRKGGTGTSLLRNQLPVDRENFHDEARRHVAVCSYQSFWYEESSDARATRLSAARGLREPGFREFGSVLLPTMTSIDGEDRFVWVSQLASLHDDHPWKANGYNPDGLTLPGLLMKMQNDFVPDTKRDHTTNPAAMVGAVA